MNSKSLKRDEAKQCISKRASRDAIAQLRLLDQRLGKGQGAKKERTRLQDLAEAKKE